MDEEKNIPACDTGFCRVPDEVYKPKREGKRWDNSCLTCGTGKSSIPGACPAPKPEKEPEEPREHKCCSCKCKLRAGKDRRPYVMPHRCDTPEEAFYKSYRDRRRKDAESDPEHSPLYEEERLRGFAVLSYLKPPVRAVAELYDRYPEGGEWGWFAFVTDKETFAYWDERKRTWQLISNFAPEQLLALKNARFRDGDMFVWDGKEGRFAVRQPAIYGIEMY